MVSGCVGFLRKDALSFGPSLLGTVRVVRKVSSFLEVGAVSKATLRESDAGTAKLSFSKPMMRPERSFISTTSSRVCSQTYSCDPSVNQTVKVCPSRSWNTFTSAIRELCPAPARLGALSGVFNRGLAGGSVERDHLSWCLSGQATRVAIANLAGHLHRSDATRQTG
jgi:hypothetical protein